MLRPDDIEILRHQEKYKQYSNMKAEDLEEYLHSKLQQTLVSKSKKTRAPLYEEDLGDDDEDSDSTSDEVLSSLRGGEAVPERIQKSKLTFYFF